MANFLNENIEGVKLLTKSVDLLQKELKETIKINQELSKSLDLGKVQDIKKLEKAVKQVTAAEKEQIKLKKQEQTLNQKLRQLRKGELDETIKLRLEVQKETKAKKEQLQATKSLTPVYDRQKKRLAAMQKQLIELSLTEKKASKSTLKLRKDVQKLNGQLSKAEQSGGQFQRQVGKYPKIFGGFTAAIGGAFLGVTGFVRVMGDAIKTAMEFEQSNANLASVLGKSRSEIGALTEDAKRLGAVTSFSASEVSTLQTEFAKLGFKENEILAATEATLDLAAATGSELGEAAAVAGATLGGFGLNHLVRRL